MEQTEESLQLCKPCLLRQNNKHAKHYCTDCDEFCCEHCCARHSTLGVVKSHNILTVEDVLPSIDHCEPCYENQHLVYPVSKCEECEEYLCNSCTIVHHSQKQNAGHTTKRIPRPVSCEPCSLNGTIKRATVFCLDCNDPEPLCHDCAHQHKLMKKTKKHRMSKDKFQLNLKFWFKGIEKGSNISDETDALKAQAPVFNVQHKMTEPNCDPCKREGKKALACYFCNDCKERYCEMCRKKHIISLNTRNHRIAEEKPHEIIKQKQERYSERRVYDVPNKSRGHYQAEHEKMNERVQDHIPCLAETNKPGKPYATGKANRSDQIILYWKESRQLGAGEFYQLKMKQHPDGNWNVLQSSTPCQNGNFKVDGLKSETSYVFKVRVINAKTDEEGPSSFESDLLTTGKSKAYIMMKRSKKTEEVYPDIYRLPIQEIKEARNESFQTRKFVLGTPSRNTKEKTIMIVGATGSGKSTLINGMANYVMGVTWEDPFRFTLIDLENCEKEQIDNQAFSQTKWISSYTLCSDVTNRIDYTINLIDTPGFGDTLGIEQDAKIVSHIREFFTAKGQKGVATLDAVCFILKSSDGRLTHTQKYIFESILAIFGNDMKKNLCTFATFADAKQPLVLAALAELKDTPIPFEVYFKFNNSALYTDNRVTRLTSCEPIFWEIGMKSYDNFFQSLMGLQTRSLVLTTEVMTKREKIQNTILNLQEEIDRGLHKMGILEQQMSIFIKHKQEIRQNESFEYEVQESKMDKIDISGQGIHTTTCLICNFTCHNGCSFPNDCDKANCIAMDTTGCCTECPKKCHWGQHSNVAYIFKWYKQKVKKTYHEMKNRYEQAKRKKMSQEEVVEEMRADIEKLEICVQYKVETLTEYGNRLKVIALRPDPMNAAQYIELMIESEIQEKASGFEDRVTALKKCKKNSEIGKTLQVFRHRLSDTQATYKASTASDENPLSDLNLNNNLTKILDFFQDLLS